MTSALVQLIENTQKSANWDQILPGTREALERIRGQYTIAVISNADGHDRRRARTAAAFATALRASPTPAMSGRKSHILLSFKPPLQQMKADPAESLYVGDMYSVDYVGARNAGMQAVLFDVAGAYRETKILRGLSLSVT